MLGTQHKSKHTKDIRVNIPKLSRKELFLNASIIPGYELQRKLGQGAMASVYLAREVKLDRLVALKVLTKKLLESDTYSERFLREARILASISHQNIVTVFDVGVSGDNHYIAMELLPGGCLTDKIKQSPRLNAAITYTKDIAKGLHHAASKDFIHRDIKPDNIMFADDGRAVITDFGIARSIQKESVMTIAGSVIGTPQYMSPEQASGNSLDHRTDLYSLGIVLFEMLAGAPPFKADSAISTGVMHITQKVPALPSKYSHFQAFIDKALAKKPDDRFQSGLEFIDALEKLAEGSGDQSFEEMPSQFPKAPTRDNVFDLPDEGIASIDISEEVQAELSSEFLGIVDSQIRTPPLSSIENTDTKNTEEETGTRETIKPIKNNPEHRKKRNKNATGINTKKPAQASKMNVRQSTRMVKSKKDVKWKVKVFVALLLLITVSGAPFIHHHIFDKPINFYQPAVQLSNTLYSITGKQFNFVPAAEKLTVISNDLSILVSNLLDQDILNEKNNVLFESKQSPINMDDIQINSKNTGSDSSE